MVSAGAGAWRVEAIGKHQRMRRTGLPARDLRALSYPSSLMGRDRAVVVSLERVRAVITASEVLVSGPRAHDQTWSFSHFSSDIHS
jgi:magnesium transporter